MTIADVRDAFSEWYFKRYHVAPDLTDTKDKSLYAAYLAGCSLIINNIDKIGA